MNITPITYNLINKSHLSRNRTSNLQGFTIPKYSHQLEADTVSFSGKKDDKTNIKKKNISHRTYTIRDRFACDYEDKKKDLLISGNRFMATLGFLERELKPYGVKFDYDYCKESIIKSTDSYISKFIRSGALPQDQIRATLFMENPYNLSILNDKIIPLLSDNGYEIKEGSDINIRLAGVNEKHLKQLDEKYHKCLGHPKKSGYEDIQLRIIDKTIPKKKQVPIELLIVFGKNYAEAKHNESYYVYDITRALENLLNISKIENPKENSPEKRVAEHINNIKKILNANISIPLFANAKSKDYYHERPKLVTELSEAQCTSLRRLMGSISYKTRLYYDNKIEKVSSDKYRNEIAGQIKHTSDYLSRTDKNITEQEITAKQDLIIDMLTKQKIEDLRIIRKAKERLDETIAQYGQSTTSHSKS